MRGCLFGGMNLFDLFHFLTLGFAVIAVKERSILIVGYYAAIMLLFLWCIYLYTAICTKKQI